MVDGELEWFELFKAYCNVNLSDKDISDWEKELAKHDAKKSELCDIMRWVSRLESVPRADQSHSSSRYDLRDVIKWLGIYRRNKWSTPKENSTGQPVRNSYVKGYCLLIDRLLSLQDFDAAAFTASGNLSGSWQNNGSGYSVMNEIWGDMKLPNRSPTPDEQSSIIAHCQMRRFDFKTVLMQYAVKNGYRQHVNVDMSKGPYFEEGKEVSLSAPPSPYKPQETTELVDTFDEEIPF